MSSSSIHDWNSASCSLEPEQSATEKWINPRTGKPDFSRFNEGNLEQRTLAAADILREGFWRSRAAASRELIFPSESLRSRTNGTKPVTQNGGNSTLLTDTQELRVVFKSSDAKVGGLKSRYRAQAVHLYAI
ncbi:hypothetical protein ACJZ2D_016808 [Fusarium nematophilum]